LGIGFVDGLVGCRGFEGFGVEWVTPYLFLLFVSNMQFMKMDTQPRLSPSLLS